MTNHPLAPVCENELAIESEKRLELRLDCLGDQPSCTRAQDFAERIVDLIFLSESNNSILVHGVTLLPGDSGGFDTTRYTAFVISGIARGPKRKKPPS